MMWDSVFFFFGGGGGGGGGPWVGFMCVCDCVCVLMCIVLESLAVHPEYQRLGAGSALVTWGTRAADEKGLTVRHPPPSSLLSLLNLPTYSSYQVSK